MVEREEVPVAANNSGARNRSIALAVRYSHVRHAVASTWDSVARFGA